MSNLTLVIGNKNYSSWSLRPWIFMRHHQLDFTEKRVALFTETIDEELAEYNSDSKVPVLKDDDLVIWDSLSILEYISEKYLDNQGWPKAERSRAIARSISAEMHSSFSNLRNELPMNCRKKFDQIILSEDAKREIERVKYLWRMCLSQNKDHGGWLFGRFSIADAMFAPVVLRFHGYSISMAEEEQEYMNRVLTHPAIVEWIDEGKQEKEIILADEVEIS